jgi:hypothetical protein
MPPTVNATMHCGRGRWGGTELTPAFKRKRGSPYNFLNDGKFLSSAPGAGAGGVSISFYERK